LTGARGPKSAWDPLVPKALSRPPQGRARTCRHRSAVRFVRLALLTLLASLAVAGATAGPAHASSACHDDVFFRYQGEWYILGDMIRSGRPVTCGTVHKVGKAYTRRQLSRVPAWRCGGKWVGGAGVRMTCVKDCSHISILVLGLTVDGRPRGTVRLPKRCSR